MPTSVFVEVEGQCLCGRREGGRCGCRDCCLWLMGVLGDEVDPPIRTPTVRLRGYKYNTALSFTINRRMMIYSLHFYM